jgi:hypothetical protein
VDFEVGLCGELGWGAFGVGDGAGCYYCEDSGWRRVGAGGVSWRVHVGVKLEQCVKYRVSCRSLDF